MIDTRHSEIFRGLDLFLWPGRLILLKMAAAAEPTNTPSTAAATAAAHRPNLGGEVSPRPSAAPEATGSGESSQGSADMSAKGARDGDEESSCRERRISSAGDDVGYINTPNPGGGATNHPTIAFSDEIQETLANTASGQSIPGQQPAVSNCNCREDWWGGLIRNITSSQYYTCRSGSGATY